LGKHYPAVAKPHADAHANAVCFALDHSGNASTGADFDLRISDRVADSLGVAMKRSFKERRSPDRRPNSDGGL
jgi:hypothetical protein